MKNPFKGKFVIAGICGIVFLIILIFALCGKAKAEPFLICDPAVAAEQVTDSRVIIDGVDYGWRAYEEAMLPAGETVCLLMDLGALTEGGHTATAQWRNVWGESPQSNPFDFTKKLPAAGSGIAVKRADR